MKTYADQLQALLKQIPGSVEEGDLPQLEKAATGFQHVLKLVQHHESGSGINTLYFYQHLQDIESALYQAKYGNNQKQRDAAFKKAKKELAAGIEDLIRFINRHTDSSTH
jgi:hypothetical protein